LLYKLNQLRIGLLLGLICYIILSLFIVQVSYAKAKDVRVRLQPIIVNGADNTFFDTETLKYIKDPYRNVLLLETWIRTDDTNLKGGYNLTKYYIRLESRQYQQMQSIDYDNNAKVIEQSKPIYSDSRWKEIIPESIADAWYHQVIKYVKDNKIISKRSVPN
jgi:hypothetical protein